VKNYVAYRYYQKIANVLVISVVMSTRM